MRMGDITAQLIGNRITIRDRDSGDSPAWVLRGRLVRVEHRVLQEPPYDQEAPYTATKVTLRVGPAELTETDLVLPSDYEF
jgi:hypothetical protein